MNSLFQMCMNREAVTNEDFRRGHNPLPNEKRALELLLRLVIFNDPVACI